MRDDNPPTFDASLSCEETSEVARANARRLTCNARNVVRVFETNYRCQWQGRRFDLREQGDIIAESSNTVDRTTWLESRRDLLVDEKRLSRLHDEVNRKRRALPRVLIDEQYVFDTASGPKSLSELFDGRSQLMIYHFMMGPD